jgi:hypothetical protein
LHHFDVEADDLALFVLAFKRRVGGVGADDVDLGRAGAGRGAEATGAGGGGGGSFLPQAAKQQAGGGKAGQLQEATSGDRGHGVPLVVAHWGR